MADMEALSYVGFSSPAQFLRDTIKMKDHVRGAETDVTQGLHGRHIWLPFYSVGDPKIALHIYIYYIDKHDI